METDYESMIMERQEATEIWEDDPDSPYLNGWHPGEDKERYEVMYDYKGKTGVRDEFNGSYADLQEHIKQMRKAGCTNIEALEIKI